MDAFAVAVCEGLAARRVLWHQAIIVGLYFGGFQALMPLIGYLVATRFAAAITAYDHWIAFVLLAFLGGRMIHGGLQPHGCPDRACPAEGCTDRTCPAGAKPRGGELDLQPAVMLPFALATSIDALAVGVTFAFLRIRILPAVSCIGLITFAISAVGVQLGHLFGSRLKGEAEVVGGALLVLIGVQIVLEHLGFLA